MQTAFKTTVKVQAGGKVEIIAPQLPADEVVEVIVLFPDVPELPTKPTRRSAMDILDESPGHRLFHTVEDVDLYVAEERATWDD